MVKLRRAIAYINTTPFALLVLSVWLWSAVLGIIYLIWSWIATEDYEQWCLDQWGVDEEIRKKFKRM